MQSNMRYKELLVAFSPNNMQPTIHNIVHGVAYFK